MASILAQPVTQIYIASATVLTLNVLFLGVATALTRDKASEVVNPEDKKPNDEAAVVFDEGNDKTARCRRAHRNALENVPIFLITGFLLTFTSISFTAAAALFGVFVVARVLHSICYVAALQPWRTATFGIGFVAQLVVLGYLGYAVIGA